MRNLESVQLTEAATPAFVMENVGALAMGGAARIGFDSLMSQGGRNQLAEGLYDGFNSGGLTATETSSEPVVMPIAMESAVANAGELQLAA